MIAGRGITQDTSVQGSEAIRKAGESPVLCKYNAWCWHYTGCMCADEVRADNTPYIGQDGNARTVF